MARTAVLQTNFREEQLAPIEPEIDQAHQIDRTRKPGWVDFGDGYGCRDPIDSRGTNLDLGTGRLFVGDIQDERPVDEAITGEHLFMRDSSIRLSILFELERLFAVPLAQLELLEVYADRELMRSNHAYVERQKVAVAAAAESYQTAFKITRFGKPVIENDYRERSEMEARTRARWGDRISPQNFRLIYGPRILALLRGR